MPSVESELAFLQIPRLAAEATSARPVWLWSADGSCLLWANAIGTAVLGVTGAAEYGNAPLAPNNPLPAQIARLAAALPSIGTERLERLRGIGAGLGRPVVCACSRIVLPNGTAALLVAACEPAGPSLPLGERVRRLFAGVTGAVAVFATDGKLLHATDTAVPRLGGAATLSALGLDQLALGLDELGLDELAAETLQSGCARSARAGTTAQFTALRLGRDDSRVLMLALPPDGAVPAQRPAEGDQAAAAVMTSPEKDFATPDLATPSAAVEEEAQSSATPSPPPSSGAPPVSATVESSPAEQSAAAAPVVAQRLHPLRFVWQMDADSRFAIGSDEFAELVGPRVIAACGRPWSEIAAGLQLDPDNRVAHAIATRETWSGIPVQWPVDDTNERLPVELSGLPVFDRDHVFRGYRGFGVCREIDRINQLARERHTRPLGFASEPELLPDAGGREEPATQARVIPSAPIAAVGQPAEPGGDADTPPHPEHPRLGIVPAAANVVPFRSAPAPEPKAPSLNAIERNAFRELAQELTARLNGSGAETATAEQAAIASDAEANPDNAIANESLLRAARPPGADHALLDRVPAGVLVYRNDALLYANRHLLELSGYDSVQTLAAAGGLRALFMAPGPAALRDSGDTQTLSITTGRGEQHPVEGRLFSVPWSGDSALALILTSGQTAERFRAAQGALEAALSENRDIKAALDRTVRREAEKTAAAKADFLAKVNHEIRTPLNSMIGFAEVILAERFGSIGNERYREYLKDMHAAGTHLVSMLNDLVDLSKVESGQLDLNFVEFDLNELTQQCVGIMQPQANRARIIIRSALTPGLARVVADERSVRQIVLNLLAHAIRFTGPGGQVIVSTAGGNGEEGVLRVRDTGAGTRETENAAAIEPLRQNAAVAGWGTNGASLGLALTKALAEANRADVTIKTAANTGTLIEIAFPADRAAAR
jgi:signal transduction histidine kinase